METVKERALLLMGLTIIAAMLSYGFVSATGAKGPIYSTRLTIRQEEGIFVAVMGLGDPVEVRYSGPPLNEEAEAKAVKIALSHPTVVKLLEDKEYEFGIESWNEVMVEETTENGQISVVIKEVRVVGLKLEITVSDGSYYAVYVDPWKGEVVAIEQDDRLDATGIFWFDEHQGSTSLG